MDNVIGLITTNYSAEGLGVLANERTVAALPFAGRYRLIDFALSNMVNAGLTTVGLVTPYKYRSIIDHVHSGKAWSLDRKNGGLFILPGSAYGISSPHSRFLLRDIARNQVFFTRSPAPYVLVSSSSYVYNMDYSGLIREHQKTGADITVVYTKAGKDDANRTCIKTEDGRVTGMKRGVKQGDNEFLDCFIVSRLLLLKINEWYSSVDYLDFFEVLEENYNKMDVRMYEYSGFSRGIFNVDDYYYSNMDILDQDNALDLFNPDAPIRTKIRDDAPAEYMAGAVTRNALIQDGCTIAGTVENSLLSGGVTVEAGAVVKNSIIMHSCRIGEGAVVENAIIDRNNVVSAGTVIKGSQGAVFVLEKNNI